MEFKYSSKDILNDLIAMRNFITQLLGRGKEYDQFLQTLLKLNYLKDENYNRINLNDISQQTGLKYPMIRKYLHLLYGDLLNQEDNHFNVSVNKVEYTFMIHAYDEFAYITLNHLPVLPRVGENIEIPFFKAKLGFTNFYVKSIHHWITDDVQGIDITLHLGKLNRYWRLRKDEAYFKRQISVNEYLRNDDSLLQEKFRSKKF